MARLRDDTKREFDAKLKWFRRSRYVLLKGEEITPYEWLLQIAFRRDVHDLVLRSLEEPNCTACGHGVDYWLGILQKTPIVKLDDKLLRVMEAGRIMSHLRGPTQFNNFYVISRMRGWFAPVVSIWNRPYDPEHPRRNRLGSSSVLFKVDLDAPDAVLVTQFESDVKLARRCRGKVKHVPFKTHKWFEIGLLPYIDVSLWALRNGIGPIPDALMGKAVLPEGSIGVEHRIRAVTRKNAEFLLNMTTHEFLERVRLMHAAVR
jgi:hypothetical protein